MDERAIQIVKEYITNHLDKSDEIPNFQVYTVWKVKVLQNWKYLISSTLLDGMYYELTYNGDKKEWYLDAYKKFENHCIIEEMMEGNICNLSEHDCSSIDLTKIKNDLKYYLANNEDTGFVYIPKFVVEKIIKEITRGE